MQIARLFAVLNISQRLKDIRVNWFPWLVILIGTGTYTWTVFSAAEAAAKHQVEASRLEQIGTVWILFGALWTALGAHITKDDRNSLDSMANQKALDPVEIVRIFKAASNFSTYGAFMIILGSAVLLYKMLVH